MGPVVVTFGEMSGNAYAIAEAVAEELATEHCGYYSDKKQGVVAPSAGGWSLARPWRKRMFGLSKMPLESGSAVSQAASRALAWRALRRSISDWNSVAHAEPELKKVCQQWSALASVKESLPRMSPSEAQSGAVSPSPII